MLATHRPGQATDTIRRLGEGQEHVAYEVDGLIVRFVKGPDRSVVLRDARLLEAVAELSPLPVPEPVFVDADEGCLAYRRLPGTPLLDLAPASHPEPIAESLGDFLAALHAAPVTRMAELVDLDDQPLDGWLADAAGEYEAVGSVVPPEHRHWIEAFLAAPPPAPAPGLVFSHNDLGIEHVLVDPTSMRIQGIIDWSDAAITDPAYDLGLILRDLGPSALDAALRAYGPSSGGLVERAWCYARCSVLEDLRYGIESGRREYAEKSLVSLAWLSTEDGQAFQMRMAPSPWPEASVRPSGE
jgi:aminoglycoside phosphotransferase (APT) family kinase protein